MEAKELKIQQNRAEQWKLAAINARLCLVQLQQASFMDKLRLLFYGSKRIDVVIDRINDLQKLEA